MPVKTEIRSNFAEATQIPQMLDKELKKAADDAAERIARGFVKESERALRKGGHVVSGSAVNSFRVESGIGRGQAKVFANNYLEELDSGTVPHYPDTKSYRFLLAAKDYGMDPEQLAEVIARKGTKPHPWIFDATKRTQRKQRARLKIEVDEAMERASKEV